MVFSFVPLCFNSPHLGIRNKLYKTLDYWPRAMLNFNLLEKGLGIVSPLHFPHTFSRKMFLVLYSIKWPNFFVSNIRLYSMCIAIVCWPSCDVINFEINLIFLIKPFFNITENSRQKFKYLENEKNFEDEIKSISHHFLKDFQLLKTVSNLRVSL